MKKYRNWIVSALGLLLWAVGFWMVKGDVRSTLAYVCIGLGCGMFGYGAGELIAGRVLKGAPELQRQMEIDRQDERNVAIADRAKGRAFDLMTFLFGALMVSFALCWWRRICSSMGTRCTGGSATTRRCDLRRQGRERPAAARAPGRLPEREAGPGFKTRSRVYLRSQKCWDIRQKASDARRMSAALLHGMQANATRQMGLFW